MMLVIATKELFLARCRHVIKPTGAIIEDLSRGTEPCRRTTLPPDTTRTLRKMSWAIDASARRVPWRSDCLLQAMAADRWMRRIGLTPEFYLGVKRGDDGGLAAHAWISHEGMPITGGDGRDFSAMIKPRPDDRTAPPG